MIDNLINVVKVTGRTIIENYSDGAAGYWEGTQYKAKADRIAHKLLVHLLTQLDHTIPIVSEEDRATLDYRNNGEYWLIDPIDGTASFAQGYPGFVTQVALIKNNKPQLAAIYAPKLDSLYTSIRGKGAYHNGKRLKVNPEDEINSLIDNYPSPKGVAKEIYDSFSCSNYIECGSISLKMCKVAEGTVDLFVKDIEVKDWDIAAPHLILEEAGGHLTDIRGEPFSYDKEISFNGIVAADSLFKCKKITSWYKRHIEKGGRG